MYFRSISRWRSGECPVEQGDQHYFACMFECVCVLLCECVLLCVCVRDDPYQSTLSGWCRVTDVLIVFSLNVSFDLPLMFICRVAMLFTLVPVLVMVVVLDTTLSG